ncbi:hypothetical protein [Rhodanobacter lindaniclasticus]
MVDHPFPGFVVKAREVGVPIRRGRRPYAITFAPSLDITHEEIDLAMSLLDQLLTKAKKADRW